jgi:hypothetical protein
VITKNNILELIGELEGFGVPRKDQYFVLTLDQAEKLLEDFGTFKEPEIDKALTVERFYDEMAALVLKKREMLKPGYLGTVYGVPLYISAVSEECRREPYSESVVEMLAAGDFNIIVTQENEQPVSFLAYLEGRKELWVRSDSKENAVGVWFLRYGGIISVEITNGTNRRLEEE